MTPFFTLDSNIAALCTPKLDADLQRALDLGKSNNLPEINVSANEGKLLYILTKLNRAKKVLEVGTLSGFSTLWLAKGMCSEGELITLEFDSLHARVAREVFDESEFANRIKIIEGDAAVSMAQLAQDQLGPFDVIFIDADKINYPKYVEMAVALSRPGTLILCDNIIRSDTSMYNNEKSEVEGTQNVTQVIDALNAKMCADPRLEVLLLPILRERVDGLSISLVK